MGESEGRIGKGLGVQICIKKRLGAAFCDLRVRMESG